jgi:hypothetical protein
VGRNGSRVVRCDGRRYEAARGPSEAPSARAEPGRTRERAHARVRAKTVPSQRAGQENRVDRASARTRAESKDRAKSVLSARARVRAESKDRAKTGGKTKKRKIKKGLDTVGRSASVHLSGESQ